MPAIHIAGLSFRYPSPTLGGSPVDALCGVDLEIEAGQFVALMGPVGAGKSTLCLTLNGAIPHLVAGEFVGRVSVCGLNTNSTAVGELVTRVGLVLENAEAQLFNATVADEVAFGLEALALAPAEIERRIDAALTLVGLEGLRQRSPRTLSGGEQKRLALASVLAMRPQVLVLDEPTASLDARGRYGVVAAIDQLRRELGAAMTVVMATQDAEAAARFADRVIVLDRGRVVLAGRPDEVFAQVEQMEGWGLDVPQLAHLARRLHLVPLYDPQQAARQWDLDRMNLVVAPEPGVGSSVPPEPASTPLIEVRDLSYDYPAAAMSALHHVTLDILSGEWLAVLGINGSGKTTLLKHLNGLFRPQQGTVRVAGRETGSCRVGELARVVSYLPQNPDQLIFTATVRDEVAYGPRQLGLQGRPLEERIDDTLARLGLSTIADHPPAVLGYGLRRQVALASVLAMAAPVLALDEPTAGLDRGTATWLLDTVAVRHAQGATVVMVTHDLQLVVQYAQRVIILQQGHLVAQGPPRDLLADVHLLRRAGLEPLPVTVLAHLRGCSPPLPLVAADWRVCD